LALLAANGLVCAATIISNGNVVFPPMFILSGFLLLTALILSIVVLLIRPGENSDGGWDLALLFLLAILYSMIALQLVYAMDIGNRSPGLINLSVISMWIVGLCVLPYFAFVPPGNPFQEKLSLFTGPAIICFLLGAGVLLKAAGIIYEPKPLIDVWEVMQAGPLNLAAGLNPYSTPIPQAAALGAAFGSPAQGYVYPPGILLLSFPSVIWMGDSRWLYVLADIASSILMMMIGRRLSSNPRVIRCADLAALIMLFHPMSFGKAWNDLLLIPFFLGFVYLHLKRPDGWMQAIVCGLAIAMKQYMIFLAPLLIMILRKPRLIAIAAAAAILPAIPFLLWNPPAFYDLLTGHLGTPFRPDSMTIPALLFNLGIAGKDQPSWIGAVAAIPLALAGIFFRRNKGLTQIVLWSAAIMMTLFTLSTHSNSNYYHFIMSLLMLGAIMSLSRHSSD